SGLVEVRIETASGREVEGLLSAITFTKAEELAVALSAGDGERPKPVDEVVLVRNEPLDLVWAGASDLRLGVVAVLMGILFEVIPQITGDGQWFTHRLAGIGGILLLLALISGTWLLGIGSAVMRGYGFRLIGSERALVAEQGLLTRRRTEVVR